MPLRQAVRQIPLLALALLIAGCATASMSLNREEIAGMRIERVDVQYIPETHIWWGAAEEEYVAHWKAKGRTASAGRQAPDDQALIESPEAKAYLRQKLSSMVKQRMDRTVVPRFNGTRAVRLEIIVHVFTIPSGIQRVTLGGTPMFGAVTVLKDAATGRELAKLDRMAASYAGQGLLGVAIDSNSSDLADRVLDKYRDQVLDWLVRG